MPLEGEPEGCSAAEGRAHRFVAEIRDRLHAAADPERAEKASSFFPNKPPILGTPSGLSRELGAELARRLKAQGDLEAVIASAEDLFGSGVMEEGACANEMVGRFWRRFSPDDWDHFHDWIGLFTCWGTTDSFCLKLLGHLVLRDGPPMPRLREWARRGSVWHRRAALVCLIRAARKGRHIDAVHELADVLLADPAEMVQKAIGWTLKEACKGDAESVIGYLRARRQSMGQLAFRHACERMTAEQRARAQSV